MVGPDRLMKTTGRKCLGKEPGKTLGQDNRAQSSGKTSLQPAEAASRALIGRKFYAKRPMQKRVLNIGPNHSQGLMIAKSIDIPDAMRCKNAPGKSLPRDVAKENTKKADAGW